MAYLKRFFGIIECIGYMALGCIMFLWLLICEIIAAIIFKIKPKKKFVKEPEIDFLPVTKQYCMAMGFQNNSTIYFEGTSRETTGEQIWKAVNDHVLELQENGIWDKIKAFYPFVDVNDEGKIISYNLKTPTKMRSFDGPLIQGNKQVKLPDGSVQLVNEKGFVVGASSVFLTDEEIIKFNQVVDDYAKLLNRNI